MDTITWIAMAILVGFIGYEGIQAVKRVSETRRMSVQIKQSKKDVQVCRDYKGIVIIYGLFAVVLIGFGLVYFINSNMLYGVTILAMALFCFITIIEVIASRTVIFYDSGFLYAGKTFKYRSVVKVDEKRKFIRGYRIFLTSEDEVYMSKNIKPIFDERMKAYKSRRKTKHEK